MSIFEILRARRSEITTLGLRYGARNIRVFGSVARGEDTEESDIDLLVEMDEDRSLLDLVGFQQALAASTGRKTDVLTERALNPYLRERILAEAIAL
jgi:predicted nucleotidyltransferase